MTGAFDRKNNKWCPTIVTPDGEVEELGVFDTREEAAVAYKARHKELYPPPQPPQVDVNSHDRLDAADFTGSPGVTYH